MRIRFVVATSVAALSVVACSSVVNGSGTAAPGVPTGVLSSPATPTATPTPSITGFPSESSSVPVPSSSSLVVPSPTLSSSSPFPTLSTSSAPVGTADFKCPYITYPYAHLSFVCVTDMMRKSTKDKVWPVVWRKVVAHYAQGNQWTLDTGAGHWGPMAGDSLRAIALKVRGAMVGNGNYGSPEPAIRTAGKQIKVGGHRAYQLVSTFSINPQFRRDSGAPIRHEKSWILAIQIGRDDVSLWYVSVPDKVKYYWPIMGSLINTISVD